MDAPHVDCVENRIFLCTVDINQIILYTMCIYICVCIYTDLNVYTCMYTVHLELVWVRLICVHVIHYVSIHVLYNMYIYTYVYMYIYICIYVHIYIFIYGHPLHDLPRSILYGNHHMFLHIKHNQKFNNLQKGRSWGAGFCTWMFHYIWVVIIISNALLFNGND